MLRICKTLNIKGITEVDTIRLISNIWYNKINFNDIAIV